MFVDTVELELSAGKGGNGVIAWRREKYIPKGGPAGGDGGHGGSIILEADDQIPSLEHLRNYRIIKAENGMPGEANNRTGRNGKDRVLKVPLGTLLKDLKTGEVICDFVQHGQTWRICKGGKGGKGNNRFKTSTHQAPYVCTPGLPGEACDVMLELKIIADIGLVGMPNAGKSTLISKLAYIEVKIAPYPFTTLRPNLGIMRCDNGQKLLIADIPGLIDKASEDKGLGFSFLKHVERTSILIFMIELAPFQGRDPFEEFEMLRRELSAYNGSLLDKPFLVALNKIDQEETRELADAFRARYPFDPSTLFEISAKEKINLDLLKKAIETIAPKETVAKQDIVAEIDELLASP
jgi:GTPase